MGIGSRIKQLCFVTFRIKKYEFLSDCKRVFGKPNLFYPLLLKGNGKIYFGTNVQIGVVSSPYFFSGYTYIEARNENSEISIGNNVAINNAFSIVCFSKVTIKDNVLIGGNCTIIDNDGHDLNSNKRNEENPNSFPVCIGENVFIGSNVSILKGVEIGENSVIGNGSVVTKNIPKNVIAAGNPAKVIRNL
ncbi:acyltransferase [Flavobacterium sp. XS2P12]|uniref:acyltransferase n=1 Tax=Flavobacterium melibiosi TaxID=3398734 RepID=UPI003A8A95E3